MGKKEFIIAVLNPEYKTFIVYVASFSSTLLIASLNSTPLNADVHLFRKPQISSLIIEETPTKVSNKYVNFMNIFFLNLVFKLPERNGINNHIIKLVNSQQPAYEPIYSLGPIELKTLKAYIETNLANKFIRPSESPVSVPILSDQKSDGSLQFCVNYRDFNNITIINWYLLPLIRESLNRLGRARWFIQFNLTNIYHQMRICKKDR